MKKKKVFLKINFLLIFFLLFLFLLKPTFAVNNPGGDTASTNPYQTFQQSLNSPEMNLNKWIGGDMGVLEATSLGLTRMIIGNIPASPSGQTNYQPGGAIGGVASLISAMYAHPPASSVEYFADLGRNLGIVKPAYAQTGVGFRGLAPILPLWKAFRNIAYLFFTIIFVLIGFAIMFRVKLNPQTVISIQNAIPRVVVALILVTFSYAIAGLLIDLIYIFIGLGVLVLGPVAGWDSIKIASEQQKYWGLGFGEGWGLIFGGTNKAVWEAFTSNIGTILGGALIWAILGVIIGFLVAGPLGAAGGAAAGVFGPVVLLELLLAIIALYVMVKLFISLVKCYISIILSVIFGPIQIMFGILPGTQMGFGSWLRNIFANIAVFPATALFMLLGWILIDQLGEAAKTGAMWSPPVIHTTGGALLSLISFGMLLMVHKIPDIVKEALRVKPFPYGAAIGEAIRGPFKLPYQVLTTVGTLRKTFEKTPTARMPQPPSRASIPQSS